MALSDKNSEKAKERKRLFKSALFCCGHCGHIDNPVIERKGSWFKYGITAAILAFFALLVLPQLSFLLAVKLGFPKMMGIALVLFFLITVAFFVPSVNMFPELPRKLYGCRGCRTKNSMKALKSDMGQKIYDRFHKHISLR